MAGRGIAIDTTSSVVRGRSGKLLASTRISPRILQALQSGVQYDNASEARLMRTLAMSIASFRPFLQRDIATMYSGVANLNRRNIGERVGVKTLCVATFVLKHPTTNMFYLGRISTVRRRAAEEGRFRGRGFIHANQSTIYARMTRDGRAYWPGANIQLTSLFAQMERGIREANYRQSGLTIVGFHSVELRILRVGAARGGSFIDTPKKLFSTRWVINVVNDDDRCFMWAVLSALHPLASNPNRMHMYEEHIDKYDWTDVGFPASIDDVRIFEENNPSIPPIHIFEYDASEPRRPFFNLSRMYTSCKSHADTVQRPIILIALSKCDMIVQDDGRSEVVKKMHYIWCKKAQALFRFKPENADRYCWKHRREYDTDESFARHLIDCDGMELTQYRFPKEGTLMKFERYRHLTPCPVVYYCDIECIQPDDVHIPCMFAIFVKSDNELLVPSEVMMFKGPHCLREGLNELFAHAKRTRDQLASAAHGIVCAQASANPLFENGPAEGDLCCMCNEPLDVYTTVKGVKKLRYRHCVDPMRGRYYGVAHKRCAVDWQRMVFPAYHHNGRGYDHHHIIVELFRQKRALDFVIAQNMERLTCMDSGPVRFVDSLQHLACSLEKAVSDLRNTPDFVFHLLNNAVSAAGNVLPLLCRKQPFPYEWFTSWESLEYKGMVERHYFRSRLHPSSSDEEISDDYEHALNIYNLASCQTMSDFMELYLQTDILLLAEVMEWYRSDSMSRNGGLDPAWYITAPSLALDEVLYHSKQEIELLHEEQEDMFNMVLGGIRGGIVQAVLRDASTSPAHEIRYFDANSLYPWAMQQALPVGGFEWVQLPLEDILATEDAATEGYFVEINCAVPRDKHDMLDDLPPCPHKAEAMPSPTALQYCDLHPDDYGNDKLIVDFSDKKNYCVHYRLLKVWMKYDMLSNVEIVRVLKFRQTPFVKGFIDMNVRVRAEAKGRPGVQNNCKRKMNSVFGKWMENVFKREQISFLANTECAEGVFLAAASKPNLKLWNTFGEGDDQFTGFSYYPEDVILNKPIFIGAAVLDLSKALMYDAFYSMKVDLPGISLVYMDTDSLVLKIPTGGIGADAQLAKTRFGALIDSTGLPNESPLKLLGQGRDKVPGYFKDELKGQAITRIIALRAKTYCYVKDGEETLKCKGVPSESRTVEDMQVLAMRDFHRALYEGENVRTVAAAIRSYEHRVRTVTLEKCALSGYDDKRWVMDDRVHTHAHGHFRIPTDTVRDVAAAFNRYSPSKRPRIFSLMYTEENVD